MHQQSRFEHLYLLAISIITIIFTAIFTAYLVNSQWSRNLEQYKNKLSFEKEASMYGFELSKELFSKAATVYQHAAHYRGAELLPNSVTPEMKSLINKLQSIDTQYPKTDSHQIFLLHNDFQIKLMASKPYIPDTLFLELAKFSLAGAKVIFKMEPNKNQYDLYIEYGKYFDNSIRVFRNSYNLEELEASVLMLNNKQN
ncbi:hypothetical protein PCIT_a1169 [Pseudoalteromonas citrea]|uniref:Uncharacterized protein n=2 Tax=Pseudoalteromonas citrea TaxID=43655 RepID=A0AAD4ALR6_9GAMM|nr:hypothetical protein [Pseudoalteromonas citrea]KAF7775070.1 hypothetical protein PCIT_a1169 [Pseudoalteromonas citrea]